MVSRRRLGRCQRRSPYAYFPPRLPGGRRCTGPTAPPAKMQSPLAAQGGGFRSSQRSLPCSWTSITTYSSQKLREMTEHTRDGQRTPACQPPWTRRRRPRALRPVLVSVRRILPRMERKSATRELHSAHWSHACEVRWPRWTPRNLLPVGWRTPLILTGGELQALMPQSDDAARGESRRPPAGHMPPRPAPCACRPRYPGRRTTESWLRPSSQPRTTGRRKYTDESGDCYPSITNPSFPRAPRPG